MKVGFVILIILSSLAPAKQTLNNGSILQNINEPKDGRAVESTATSHNYHCGLFRSDPSACARNSNQFVMRNKPQSRKATGALLGQTKVPAIALYAAAITTDAGFYREYFNALPRFSSREEAFNAVNVDHYLLHNSYRFSSFQEFRSTIFKNLKYEA